MKGRRKVSSRKPAGARLCCPTPSRFEAEQRKNRLSVKLTYGVATLGQGHGSRRKAWASQELAVILKSSLTNWIEPPVARPSTHCSRRCLPLLYFLVVVLLCAGMKPCRSHQTSWGAGMFSCFFDCNIYGIRQGMKCLPPANVPIWLQSVCLYCLL